MQEFANNQPVRQYVVPADFDRRIVNNIAESVTGHGTGVASVAVGQYLGLAKQYVPWVAVKYKE
jgi:hypothetical protein